MACQRNLRESLSASSEMYLLELARLERDTEPVPMRELAQALDVSPVSANEMCRRLEQQGLLEYIPYRGSRLLASGRRVASRVERCHGLWQVFLVDHLGLEPGVAESMACELEHITTQELEERLDAFLERPTHTPGGLPITPAEAESQTLSLASLAVGMSGRVVCIQASEGIADYLTEAGLVAGARIEIRARCSHGTLLAADENLVTLTGELEEAVWVLASEGERNAAA